MLDIQQILTSFEKCKVLVIGDVMVDHYVHGVVNRISPEAPVPIVEVIKQSYTAGGAANVACNIQALGATPFLCSIIGPDQAGKQLLNSLETHNIDTSYLNISDTRKTTSKKRILAQGQQMLRVDEEDRQFLDSQEETIFLSTIQRILEEQVIDIIIIQDYNKGILYPTTIEEILQLARNKNIRVAVDPKVDHFFEYKNVALFKPNLREMRQQYPYITASFHSLNKATAQLTAQLGNRETLITLSEKGLFYAHQQSAILVPTIPRNIADVSGAGDSVISVASLGIAANLDRKTIAILSNLAGGQVCEKVGVVPINKEVLSQDYLHYKAPASIITSS